MAKVYGMPGRYAAAEAGKRSDRFLVAVLFFLIAAGFGSGFFAASHGASWSGAAVGLFILAAAFGVFRVLDRHFVALNRERRAYLRGANGEALIGVLLEQLPRRWHVFHGVQIEEYRDIDHIVVGPAGLFAVSTKNYRGTFAAGSDGEFLYNGRSSMLGKQAVAQAMSLRERLATLVPQADVYVHAVLAVPFAWIDLRNPHQYVWVLHQDNLLDTLEVMPRRLSDRQTRAYVRALKEIRQAGPTRTLTGV